MGEIEEGKVCQVITLNTNKVKVEKNRAKKGGRTKLKTVNIYIKVKVKEKEEESTLNLYHKVCNKKGEKGLIAKHESQKVACPMSLNFVI